MAFLILAFGCTQQTTAPPMTNTTPSAPSGSAPAVTVKTGTTSLGTVLTDSNGFTLYVFTADSYNQSTCTGGCLGVWPALVPNGQPSAASGVSGTLGTIQRSDGTMQVTYNGMPLYRYSSDTAPGQTNGQGVGGKWYAATPGMTSFPSSAGSGS